MARKEIAEFILYKLSWGCPRWAGKGENPGDSPKCVFSVSSRRDKKQKPALPTSLNVHGWRQPQARSARSLQQGF
jgi:hypothetical protein